MMGGSGAPVATIRPGAVQAIFDHLAVSLTADGRPQRQPKEWVERFKAISERA